MRDSDKRTKLIKEIMEKKEYYDGILLQDLYDLIRSHPDFNWAYEKAIENNPEQYQHSTRALLQHRAPGVKNFKGKEKDFQLITRGKWTYFGNPKYRAEQEIQEEVSEKIKQLEKVEQNLNLSSEEKRAFVKVRINQTSFRSALLKELKMLNTGSPFKDISKESLLIASHIVDYSDCEDYWEKGTYNNGLILSPDIDKLFDRKYISFKDDTGEPIFKDIDDETIKKLGLKDKLTLPQSFLTDDRREFLRKRNELYKFI